MEDSCPGKLSLLAYRPMNKDLTQFVCLESNGHNSSTESHYNEHDYSCGKIESPVEGDLDLATNYEQCTEEVVQDGEWGADIEFIFAEEEPSPDPLEDELDEETGKSGSVVQSEFDSGIFKQSHLDPQKEGSDPAMASKLPESEASIRAGVHDTDGKGDYG